MCIYNVYWRLKPARITTEKLYYLRVISNVSCVYFHFHSLLSQWIVCVYRDRSRNFVCDSSQSAKRSLFLSSMFIASGLFIATAVSICDRRSEWEKTERKIELVLCGRKLAFSFTSGKHNKQTKYREEEKKGEWACKAPWWLLLLFFLSVCISMFIFCSLSFNSRASKQNFPELPFTQDVHTVLGYWINEKDREQT